MKQIPTALQDMLDSGVTTLCHCWLLTRQDGLRLGFTNHDCDLEFDNTTFTAQPGMQMSIAAQKQGFKGLDVDIQSVLNSDFITDADCQKGLWDKAGVTIWRVNWQDVTQRIILNSGYIRALSWHDTIWIAELASWLEEWERPCGQIFQKSCNAVLGDTACGIDLENPSHHQDGAVGTVTSDTRLNSTELVGKPPGWFEHGFITWITGTNSGTKQPIRSYHPADGSLELWHPTTFPIQIGDNFRAYAGCDRSFTMCRERFGNQLNFRGFPYLPGNDWLIAGQRAHKPL